LVNPFLNKFKRRGLVSIILFFIIIVCLFLFFYYLVPLIYKEVNELVKVIPNIYNFFELKLLDLGININSFEIDINKIIEYVPKYVIGFLKGCFKYIGSIFIGLIIGLYMSMEYNKIIEFMIGVIPNKYKCEIVGILDKISIEVRKCVSGMLLVSFSIFILDTIAFLILGLDSPILLGILCGLTDLIPYIGPYIGGGIVLLVALSESKGIIIATLIVIVIIQCIENYVLQPIIMSKSTRISPLLIIIGLLVFGNLFGIVGMLLATPLVCIVRVIYLYLGDIREKCKKLNKLR
jgi:predicted PurR-regulated permease PerM